MARFAGWLGSTLVATLGVFVKFASLMSALMLAKAYVRGWSIRELFISEVALVVASSILAASFAFAALAPLRRRWSIGYYASWSLAGMVALPVFMSVGEVALGPEYNPAVTSLFTDPLWWAFWGACGGLTGYAYGRVAGMGRPGPELTSNKID